MIEPRFPQSGEEQSNLQTMDEIHSVADETHDEQGTNTQFTVQHITLRFSEEYAYLDVYIYICFRVVVVYARIHMVHAVNQFCSHAG